MGDTIVVSGYDNGSHGRYGQDPSNTKRKRSSSAADEDRNSSRVYDYSPPKRAEHHQHMADRALHVLDTVSQDGHTYRATPNGVDNGYGWAADHSQDGRESVSEDRLDNGYQHDGRGQAGQQQPRKRNFSNRTKTGCMTCRTRKKKCDEGHPACK